ncbi:endoribonuclease L-PSP [Metarhizium robertsii ARSEF 23]|uniref:Endoribonuclease L-PSP n=1 Tax=Metarhizium robertsii (strain ARSEF 23 / ATCC MYA-3075) TaxID=655844 RepID=A0A0B2X899_METRA|nr:endoribonuclease L-PSP [Metarhizium robertsii ARSEF 23]KHO11103.1 endoribonuclease L-PSP [Metarhizium robertsii ARSEF 23]
MEPPKDLVIAISGGFSVHGKKGKTNKALKQQDIKMFFKDKGVIAYLSQEIGNSGKIQDDKWNVLLSSDDNKGGETAIFKGAKQKGLCILGEAWLQGCIDEDKVIQPREEHFRQKPTKRAYSTPHRTPSVFEYLNSEKEGTSDETNEKDRERAEKKRKGQEEKERKSKEKGEAEEKKSREEEEKRKEEEEKEEEEKKKRREGKKKRGEEEKNGESGTDLSGNDGSETESSGEESDGATNSSSGGEESDTDMDSDEEFQQFSQNVDPAVRERMECSRSRVSRANTLSEDGDELSKILFTLCQRENMNRVYVGGMFDLSMFGPDISTWSPRFAHYTAHVDHASIGFCQDAALPVVRVARQMPPGLEMRIQFVLLTYKDAKFALESMSIFLPRRQQILLKEVFDKAWQEDGLSDDLRQ